MSPDEIEVDLNQRIETARDVATTGAGIAYRALLRAAIEQWKEEAIGKSPDEVEKLHGAIIHVRDLLDTIEDQPRDGKQPTGGYA